MRPLFWVVLALLPLMMGAPLLAIDYARVNGAAITEQDVLDTLVAFSEEDKQRVMNDPKAVALIVDNLIEQQILVQRAVAKGLESSKEYKRAMSVARENYLSNQVLSQEVDSKVTREAVQNFYKKNRLQFAETKVHVMHILLETEEQAKKVLALALQRGANFQALALKYSRDTGVKSNKGDLGFITRDFPIPRFKDAVYSTAEGKIGGPVLTALGYHVFKVVSRKGGRTPGFYEVEPKVREAYRFQLIKEHIAALKNNAQIERLK